MTKNLIAIRGLRGVMDDDAVIAFSKKHDYDLKIFNHTQYTDIVEYLTILKDPHTELLGFSKGAEVAYKVASMRPKFEFRRLITIGTYHTVTSSFGTKTRPVLKNVRVHYNFIEVFQQPANFDQNPINISLGEVSHYNSVKVALTLLEKLP